MPASITKRDEKTLEHLIKVHMFLLKEEVLMHKQFYYDDIKAFWRYIDFADTRNCAGLTKKYKKYLDKLKKMIIIIAEYNNPTLAPSNSLYAH